MYATANYSLRGTIPFSVARLAADFPLQKKYSSFIIMIIVEN